MQRADRLLAIKYLGSIVIMKFASKPGSSFGVTSELLIMCLNSVRGDREVNACLVLFSFGDVSMNEAVCFAEHVKGMKCCMMSVGVSEVVETDSSEAHEDVASHGCRGTVPVNEFGADKLVGEGIGALGLHFAVNGEERKSLSDVGKAA